MAFRKTIFWLHLIAGLIGGISIAIMCVTGTLLAFEKQLVAWSERDVSTVAAPSASSPRLGIDELTRRVREAKPDARPTAVTLSADPAAAIAFSLGRDSVVYVDPYTGIVRSPNSTKLRDFLRASESWHRFLALEGDRRPLGKTINGICNLAFAILAVTGLYLWLPRSWSWRSVRGIALFNTRLSGKARDFNWHNSIGLWSAPILIILTLTALPISFRWANNLIYRLVGEEAPTQLGPGAPAPTFEFPSSPEGTRPLDRAVLFARIQSEFPLWEQITLRLAAPGRATAAKESRGADQSIRTETNGQIPKPTPLIFTVKTPGAWPRTALTTVTLNPYTGDTLRREDFRDQTTGRQIRSWTRFLHTGEAFGWIGQLLAGLGSLGGGVLVYTGFALAWRRFFRKQPA